MAAILVVNAGSSSLKFQVFDSEADGLKRRLRGQIDGVGARPRLRAEDAAGTVLIDERSAVADIPDLPHALDRARIWLRDAMDERPLRAIGHRVVHGGPDYAAPVLIDRSVLKALRRYQNLAPLHQPNNLAPIELAMAIDPSLPQVACFDTAFHRSHAPHEDCYALPWRFYEQGVRRYGFHGLSYEYIAHRLGAVAPDLARGRTIVAHLGSGASMCALRDGRSVENTMGFTALDGLPMGTRPGQVDAGVVLHLILQDGMTAAAVNDLLYRDAGLKGLSGVSNDMRDLLASADPQAALAVDHFIHRAGLFAGMLAAAMQGVDGVVFTAGIGENAPEIRARIAARLRWLGAELDAQANAAGAMRISTPDSRIDMLVLPTDEEWIIARHTAALIGLSSES